MNVGAWNEFLNSIPEIPTNIPEEFRNDLIGMYAARTLQNFEAFWRNYPNGAQIIRDKFVRNLGEKWETYYLDYQKKSRSPLSIMLNN